MILKVPIYIEVEGSIYDAKDLASKMQLKLTDKLYGASPNKYYIVKTVDQEGFPKDRKVTLLRNEEVLERLRQGTAGGQNSK